MKCAVLAWSLDSVAVLTDKSRFVGKLIISPEDRFGLRLASDVFGRLYVRAPGEKGAFWVSEDQGLTFVTIEPIPGMSTPVSVYDCKLHSRTGFLTALEGPRLWLYKPAVGHWWRRELPQDLNVRDVSIDPDGGLWCAGSVSSRRIPGEEKEAALRYQAQPGTPFAARSPRLSVSDATRVIANGGLAELRTIDAESNNPVVATSICSWLLDDNSSFVFLWVGNRTFAKRLKAEMVCYLDRPQPGVVRLFTHQGSRWQGEKSNWKQYSMVSAIQKALAAEKRHILIRGLDASQNQIAAAVEISPAGADDHIQDPEFTAVCLSDDDGRSFQLLYRFNFSEGIEIQDVAFIRNGSDLRQTA
jgi:hypothetical protein